MSYLQIHKVIWLILCVLALIIYIFFYLLENIFYFLWVFKVFNWKDYTMRMPLEDNGFRFEDDPLETLELWYSYWEWKE